MSIRTHARQVYLGTAAERAVTTPDAEAVGVRFFETDTGQEYIWTGAAWVSGGSGGGYPYNFVTVDATDADADYTGVGQLDVAFGVEGVATYSIGLGTFTQVTNEVPDGSHLFQFVRSASNGITGSMNVGGTTYGLNLDGDVHMFGVYALREDNSNPAGGLYVPNSSTVLDWFGQLSGITTGGADNAYGIVAGTSCTISIYGGYIGASSVGGTAYGISAGASSVVYLNGCPVINADTFFTGAGTFTGIFQNLSGDLYSIDGAAGTEVALGAGNTLDEAYDEGGGGAGRSITVDSGAVELSGTDLLLNMGSYIWPMGGEVLNLDFTGTNYDTDAEMNAVGIRLSDADTPFPGILYQTISGSWSHSAGNGWQPASVVNSQGPGMLIPLMRSPNWQLEIVVNYDAQNVAHMMNMIIGYFSNSNHFGGFGYITDNSAVASQLGASLWTNDGDDTITSRYAGAILAGTGNRTYAFRCKTGTIGIYDEQDDAWHNYIGHQSAGQSYSGDYAFLQISKGSGDLAQLYIANLTLTYLL